MREVFSGPNFMKLESFCEVKMLNEVDSEKDRCGVYVNSESFFSHQSHIGKEFYGVRALKTTVVDIVFDKRNGIIYEILADGRVYSTAINMFMQIHMVPLRDEEIEDENQSV